MAIVPGVGQNQVSLNPLPQQRLRPVDFGGDQVARAVEGFGRDLSKAAQDYDDIEARYDTAAVKTKEAEALQQIAPIRNAVLTSKGMDAVPARAKAQADIAGIRKQFTTSLANPRQRQMFEDAFARVEMAEFETYTGHENKQMAVAEAAGAEARFSANMDRALGLRSNPAQSRAALADALVEIDNANRGALPEVKARKRAEATSEYHVGIANALIDQDGDTLAADDYVKQHGGEILDTDETKWRKGNRDTIEEAQDDVAWGQIVEQAGSGKPPPDTAETKEASAKFNSDPLRGKGRSTSGFTAARDGGKRQHAAEDLAAPAGTPVYPPMGGKVTKVWFDKAGGNSVLVEHPDGRVTGYAHLRNVNVDVGDAVDADTVLGGVGNTGAASRGNHLHFTVRQGGKRVDPAAQSWKGGPLQRYTDERVDKQALYDRVHDYADRENLSPRQYDRLLRRADQFVARNDALKSRAEEDATDRAYEAIDAIEAKGGAFTSMSQVPASALSSMGAKQRNALRGVAEANLKRQTTGEDIPANGDTFWDLYEMAGNPQAADRFEKFDLRPLQGQMSKGEYTRLRKLQVDGRNKDGAEKGTTLSRVQSTVSKMIALSPGMSLEGKKGKEKERVRSVRARVLNTIYEQARAAEQKKGGKLSEDEFLALVKPNLATIYTGDDFSVATPRGAYQGGPAKIVVPQADRAQIIAAWRKTRPGVPVTEGDIARLYVQSGGSIQ